MSPTLPIIKSYTITGPKWNPQNLILHHLPADSIIGKPEPTLYITANNKHGPFTGPYITLHRSAYNGPIVAAAKMSIPGCKRDFRIWLGNPDCTDLDAWTRVKCCGVWAGEYAFEVGGRRFVWRRTRRGGGRGHRDFKLVEVLSLDTGEIPVEQEGDGGDEVVVGGEKCLLDFGTSSESSDRPPSFDLSLRCKETGQRERIIAVYATNHKPFKNNRREAKIHFFESLSSEEIELWCLAAVFGLQEKISKNQQALALASFGYGGLLWPLGRYM